MISMLGTGSVPGAVSIHFTLFWWLGVAVGIALVATALFIVGRSVRTEHLRLKKAAARPDVRTALFDRLKRESPAWEAWTNELSTAEREVLRELLNDHLRLLDGSDRERLQPLVAALGIHTWAVRTLETGDRYAKLAALEWLALVDHPPDPDLLMRACAGNGDDELRAAGARVVVEQAYPDAAALGIRLLLEDSTEPLSAFGLDTLYQITKSKPGLLVEHARAYHDEWDPALLTQGFLVLRHVDLLDIEETFEWIIDQCEHDSVTVRAAAVRSLTNSGWRAEVRSQFPVAALTNDPSPAVRQAVYQTLGEWSDAEACAALYRATRHESDPRSRLVAVTALYRSRCRDRLDAAVQREFPRLWDWVAAAETRARGEIR